MSAPSILILAWCGLAATIVAALTGVAVARATPHAWALLPRATSRASALVISLLTGTVFYPILYGFIFEALHRADLIAGLLLGSLHAVIAFALARSVAPTRSALRVAAMHLTYGITLALLYVTP